MMFLNRMDAQTTVAEENSKIAWKSIEGDVNNEGEMYFIKLSEDETLVTVSTMFDVPLGFVDLPPKNCASCSCYCRHHSRVIRYQSISHLPFCIYVSIC